MNKLAILKVRHDLIRYAADNDLNIIQCDNEMFHAENTYSGLRIEVSHVLQSLSQGWTVDDVAQNESYAIVDENGDQL